MNNRNMMKVHWLGWTMCRSKLTIELILPPFQSGIGSPYECVFTPVDLDFIMTASLLSPVTAKDPVCNMLNMCDRTVSKYRLSVYWLG